MGALAAGETGRAVLPILDNYAQAIGLAFQVQDDILDVVGDTATLGKRQGADQQLGKSTYPALLGWMARKPRPQTCIRKPFPHWISWPHFPTTRRHFSR